MHASIRTINHLGELLNLHFYDAGELPKKKKIQCHRTKCTAIILNVIFPSFADQEKKELGNSFFSVIIDESTDVGHNNKFMAYCIRYYNEVRGEIVTDFIGLQFVGETTGEVLFKNFVEFFENIGIDLNRMIALATDGASNLTGEHNSLFSRLKAKFPKLILLKCICHSLAKCAEYATAELPSSLEYMLRETRNWFSYSPLRKLMFAKLVEMLSGKLPPKLSSLAPTRWLSFNTAVKENLEQWDNLRAHFQNVVKESEKDRKKSCVTARTLLSMYDDKTNKLYLLCVSSILDQVNTVNLVFQSNNINIVNAYNDLYLLVSSSARRIFKPSFLKVDNKIEDIIERRTKELECIKIAVEKSYKDFGNSVLSLDDVDYGYKFEQYLSELKTDNLITISDEKIVKQKCCAFLLKLMSELMKRIPHNFESIVRVQYFTPKFFLGAAVRINHTCLPWDLIPNGWCQENIKNQWDQLCLLQIEDIYGSKKDLTSLDSVNFWITVGEMKNALNKCMFRELADFAILALSLPISNAAVERIFSLMNCIKTKLRNRMGTLMLNAILHARSFAHVRKFCCNTFIPSADMYLSHNKNMYKVKTDDSTSTITLDAEQSYEINLFYDALLAEMEEDSPSALITLHAADDDATI
jgi:hypothetical protein